MVWKALGLGCARVPHVILTHLHTIHQNLEDFPAATFVVQKRAFWTGRFAGEQFRTLIEPNDVLYLVQENSGAGYVSSSWYPGRSCQDRSPPNRRTLGGRGCRWCGRRPDEGSVVLASDTTCYSTRT